MALGNHLSKYGARVWAYGVCDDPDYFYEYIDGIFEGLGVPEGKSQAIKHVFTICCPDSEPGLYLSHAS